MSSDPVTKDEIRAMIDVQAKHVEQMVLVAQRLQTIVEYQEKITARLYNGMAREITEAVKKDIGEKIDHLQQNNCNTVCKNIETVKKDVGWLRIILGSAALIFAIGMIANQAFHFWFHTPKGGL